MDRLDNTSLTIINATMLAILASLIFGVQVLFWLALAATPVAFVLMIWLAAGRRATAEVRPREE